jgi:prepilin signal peptidase PulO-like enzyme (type II secretory pathway)
VKELTLVEWLKKVAVNIILNPFFALILFMIGIWMGSMIDPLFGIITIFGGLLLGSLAHLKTMKL